MIPDLLIRGGTVLDGVSDAPRDADVLVRGDAIVAVRERGATAGRPLAASQDRPQCVIDAAGKYVLPGFIDIHGHSDFNWLIWPNATSKLLTGVTTDVGGNCGYGAFPLAGEVLARRQAEYERYRLRIDWADAAGYFARLDATPCAANRAVLVGHGNVRGVTMGYAARGSTAAERAQMRRLVEAGLAAGAFGLSSGLIYPPGCFADADELADLAAVAARHGGLYASHVRDECDGLLAAADEFLDVVRRGGCRGQFSHLKTGGRSAWPLLDDLHAKLVAARADGIDLHADRYPYLAGATSLSAMVLPTAALAGTRADVLARLTNAARRRQVAEAARASGRDGDFFDDVVVVSVACDDLRDCAGKSLRQIGELRGREPLEAAFDLLVEDELAPDAVHFCMNPENLERILGWDFVMVASDSSVRDALADGDLCHPRCFGTPAAFLATFVREKRVCDWPTAARKLAAMPAEVLGLSDRGRIATGCRADLVVLDPARVADRATYQRPRRPPDGIDCVLVNGEVAVEGGHFTGAMAGRVLRRP